MAAFVLGLIVLGIAEISALVALSEAISWELTLLAVIVIGAVGAWIVKREGTATWRRVLADVRVGQMPTTTLLDGGLVVVAGFLLLLPGLISDVAALALTVPRVRAVVRERLTDHFQRRIAARASTVRTSTVFGFGGPGFGGFATGFGDAPGATGRSRRRDDDIIDLDGEEVVIDLPPAELDPPRDRPA